MDSKDIITLVIAVLIVAGMAVVVHPSQEHAENTTPILNPQMPENPVNSSLTREVCQISYNPDLDDIYVPGDAGYPRTLLPDNFDLLCWGSDVVGADRWNEDEWIEFACLHEAHGGLTQAFRVPYGIWRINTEITAEKTPQYAILRWALVDGDSGKIYQGSEIRHKGNSTRIVRNLEGNPALYLIIASQNVDEFRLGFETPGDLYDPDTPIQTETVVRM